MSDYKKDPVLQSDEIDLFAVFAAVWRYKWILIFSTLFFAVLAFFYANSLPNQYETEVILVPSSSGSGSASSSIDGQFSGLASLAGIKLRRGEADQVTVALTLLKTWGFLEEFIKKTQIEEELKAVVYWDEGSKKLVYDPSIYNEEKSEWVADNKGVSKRPGSWDLYKELSKRISVSRDEKTGLVTLRVKYYSPIVAKQWAVALVNSLNTYMQNRDKEEALDSIEYLKKQIDRTDIAEMRAIFFELIEQQTKSLMLAEVSKEYVFKTISQAKVPEVPSGPNRALIVIMGLGLGVLISFLLIFFTGLRKTKEV